MALPETRYAKGSDIRIAYPVIGNGPLDLVFVPGFVSNLDTQWDDPGFTHLMTRLSSFTRLIMLDKRGTGLSDRVDMHHLPSLETRMDDVRAVAQTARRVRRRADVHLFRGNRSQAQARSDSLRLLYGAYAHFHTWVMSHDSLRGLYSWH